MVLQERPGDFLRNGTAFCLSDLGFMGSFVAGLSLTGSKVEGGGGSRLSLAIRTRRRYG